MSLIKQIEKLGISVDQVSSLTDEEIIRIEKKLKVEARLNETLDINEVRSILETLKSNKEHLQHFFSQPYYHLREILEIESGFVLIGRNERFELEASEDFIAFLNENFQSELNTYVERCLKDDHYLALHSFLLHIDVLRADILEPIIRKIHQKMIYMTECIYLQTEQLEKKIMPGMNPYFYRCLNLLGGLEFEAEIRRLLNTTIERLEERKTNFRVLYAMGSYKAVNEHVGEILAENKKIAAQYGVREINYTKGIRDGRGGTYVMSKPSYGSPRSSKSGNGGSWGGVGVVAFIIIMVIRVLVMTSKNDRTNDFEFTVPDYFNNEWVNNRENYQSRSDDDFYGDILFMHTDTFNMLTRKAIGFNIAETPYADHEGFLGTVYPYNMVLYNETEKMMLIHVEGEAKNRERYIFLKPGGQDTIPAASSGIRIYTGKEPEVITYIDDRFRTHEKFRFGIFEETDREIFETYYELNRKETFMVDFEGHIVSDGDLLELEIEKIDNSQDLFN